MTSADHVIVTTSELSGFAPNPIPGKKQSRIRDTFLIFNRLMGARNLLPRLVPTPSLLGGFSIVATRLLLLLAPLHTLGDVRVGFNGLSNALLKVFQGSVHQVHYH